VCRISYVKCSRSNFTLSDCLELKTKLIISTNQFKRDMLKNGHKKFGNSMLWKEWPAIIFVCHFSLFDTQKT